MAQDTVVSEIRHNFHKVYYDKIAPMMEKYEKQRKSEWKKIYLIDSIFVAIFLLAVYLEWSFIQETKAADAAAMYIMFIDIPLLAIIFGIPCVKNYFFTKKLKQECMSSVISAFGNIKWFRNSDYSGNYNLNLDRSELFSKYNRRGDDDIFEGSFRDIKYSISETHLSYRSSGKNSRTKTVFSGVIVSFESNKTIKNKTVITSKNDKTVKNKGKMAFAILFILMFLFFFLMTKSIEMIVLNSIMLLLFLFAYLQKKSDKSIEVLKEIKLEDPEFNKKYRAYSSDEVEGRYLITPAFMERFKNIQKAFRSAQIKCSFFDNILMVAISSQKNWFEIGNLFTPLNRPKQLENFFKELLSILSMIDYLKLYEKTGL